MANQIDGYHGLSSSVANVPIEYWPGGNEASFPPKYESSIGELFEQGLVHRTLSAKTIERKAQRERKETRESVV
jgi:hypothetical protein